MWLMLNKALLQDVCFMLMKLNVLIQRFSQLLADIHIQRGETNVEV